MSNRMYVATRKGLFTLDRGRGGASEWSVSRTAFLGVPVSMVLPDRRDRFVYAAVGHGHFGAKLHRSPDGGDTWEECAAPAYPPAPEGEEWRCTARNIPIPQSLELIWALESGGRDEPGVLWCGTLPGGLFRSPDRGSTWELNQALWNNPSRKAWFGGGMDYPGIHSIVIDPKDSRRVTIGISCGGVWVTENAGRTWDCRAKGMWANYMPPERKFDSDIQDPHRMVACPARPEVLWVQHHNGVFRSRDGAMSWQDVETVKPSTFGFAVAVHPAKPDTAWLVPALSDERRIPVDGKVVVARTRDGGKTFDVLRDGLPQRHAYDLTFRHALDVDESGDHLAFGSTSGSLWTTDDQGDHWHTVTANLPPVYCVRFA